MFSLDFLPQDCLKSWEGKIFLAEGVMVKKCDLYKNWSSLQTDPLPAAADKYCQTLFQPGLS